MGEIQMNNSKEDKNNWAIKACLDPAHNPASCPLCSKPHTSSDKLCAICSGEIFFIIGYSRTEVYASAVWWSFDRIISDTCKETIGYSMFVHITKKNNINVS